MCLLLRVRLWSALVAFFRTTRVLLRLPMPFNISALPNLGVTLFLLMADSCSRSKLSTQSCNNKSPFSYKFRNMLATSNFCIIPLMKTFITSAVLSSLYLLLLSIQRPAEILTWHWQSPVWLAVCKAYRLLQLITGLKLVPELSTIMYPNMSRWVLIFGVPLMRVVAWSARAARQQQAASSSADD